MYKHKIKERSTKEESTKKNPIAYKRMPTNIGRLNKSVILKKPEEPIFIKIVPLAAKMEAKKSNKKFLIVIFEIN
jgi:hypothetical protein